MNPSSTLAVFGGSEANLRVGLETLLGVLNASSRQGLNAELTRYTLSLMVLERKLSSAKGALDTLGNRINGLQRQLEHFDLKFAQPCWQAFAPPCSGTRSAAVVCN